METIDPLPLSEDSAGPETAVSVVSQPPAPPEPPAPAGTASAPLPDALRAISPRAAVRGAFWLFFVWSCWRLWQYYGWALGNGPYVPRPHATGGFVPLGAFMSLFAWLRSGVFDAVMPAYVVIVLGAMAVSLLWKRGFCGWICPVGATVSFFGWLGRTAFGRHLRVGRRIDVVLRIPKYLFTAAILAQLAALPAVYALQFQRLPYYATADLKILYGILHPAASYLWIAAVVAATSAMWGNTWCRYLCPLGALYGVLGALSPATVRRDAGTCTACGRCAKACPARVRVDAVRAVRDTECDGCMECVRACPQPGALSAAVGRARLPWKAWPVAVVLTWLLVWGVALGTGNWRTPLPDDIVAAHMRIMKTTADMPSGSTGP